jgi:predicted kinase
MKFIMLNGSSCSGKSTLVQKILENKENYYQLSYDSLKWSFSQYKPNTHFNDVRKLVRAVAESICEMKYNIVCDSALHQETRDALLRIPKEHGYEIIEINLEADYEILAQRFDERVDAALAKQSKRISNTSKERFKEIYDIYQSEKNPSAITFRTDTETIESVTEKVLMLV